MARIATVYLTALFSHGVGWSDNNEVNDIRSSMGLALFQFLFSLSLWVARGRICGFEPKVLLFFKAIFSSFPREEERHSGSVNNDKNKKDQARITTSTGRTTLNATLCYLPTNQHRDIVVFGGGEIRTGG